MSTQTDSYGRAFAGSQLQIQTYVNRRRDELNTALSKAIPEIASRCATIEWVSPIEEDRFAEYQDAEFLSRLGLLELRRELAFGLRVALTGTLWPKLFFRTKQVGA